MSHVNYPFLSINTEDLQLRCINKPKAKGAGRKAHGYRENNSFARHLKPAGCIEQFSHPATLGLVVIYTPCTSNFILKIYELLDLRFCINVWVTGKGGGVDCV